MKKKIDRILEEIGGWATFVFMVVVLIPMTIISKFIETIGTITNISFVKRFSVIIGIGIAFIYLDILNMSLELGAYGETKEKLESLQDSFKNYIETMKNRL